MEREVRKGYTQRISDAEKKRRKERKESRQLTRQLFLTEKLDAREPVKPMVSGGKQ